MTLQDGNLCVTVSKFDAPLMRRGKTFTHQGTIVRSLYPGQPGWYFEGRMTAIATHSNGIKSLTKFD